MTAPDGRATRADRRARRRGAVKAAAPIGAGGHPPEKGARDARRDASGSRAGGADAGESLWQNDGGDGP